MEKLISYQTAKLAKEKGFDWETLHYHSTYNGVYDEEDAKKGYTGSGIPTTNWNKDKKNDSDVYLFSAPTQSYLQKWLRDNFNIHVTPNETFTHSYITNIGYYANVYKPNPENEYGFDILYSAQTFCGYHEEALEEGLFNALLLI